MGNTDLENQNMVWHDVLVTLFEHYSPDLSASAPYWRVHALTEALGGMPEMSMLYARGTGVPEDLLEASYHMIYGR